MLGKGKKMVTKQLPFASLEHPGRCSLSHKPPPHSRSMAGTTTFTHLCLDLMLPTAKFSSVSNLLLLQHMS